MANKNSVNGELTTLDTLPLSSAATGTMSSDFTTKWVFGVGTAFESEFNDGDWIFDTTNNQIARIDRVISDTEIYLVDGFEIDVPAPIAFKKVEQSRAREISITNVGGSDTTIDGVTFKAGLAKSWSEAMLYNGAQRDFVDPLIVDGATSACSYLITL
jgi:hypothetical protein